MDSPDRAQTPENGPAATPPGTTRVWKSCAEQMYAQADLSTASLQAQFKRPQNIVQMLQNLKLAWQNDWLLRPDFYDDETLLKFFNGVAVTWKQGSNDHTIVVETNSGAFPQMPVVIETNCGWLSVPKPNGQVKAVVSIRGSLRIYGGPIPGLTQASVRQVFGAETQNAIDFEFAGGSGYPPTNKGSVVYSDEAKQKLKGQGIGLTFYFSVPPKSAESFQRQIQADDVVQGIVLIDGRQRNLEN